MVSKADIVDFLNRRLRRFDTALIRRSELWRMSTTLGRQPPPGPPSPARAPLLRVFGPDGDSTEAEGAKAGGAKAGGAEAGGAEAGPAFAFAVVMPSILRPTIAAALRSVFAQDLPGRVQTLIGIDKPVGDVALIAEICRDRPPHHSVVLFDPGYSTSARHGGLHPAWDGGVLRTVLSYLAASRYVAYLDDDNWWAPDHLSALGAALDGHDWAWSGRWLVDPHTRQPACKDVWESVGPGQGVFPDGWVDPNCLAIDKLACEAVLRWWGLPKPDSPTATDADANIFRLLSREFRGRGTGGFTAYYAVKDKIPVYPAAAR